MAKQDKKPRVTWAQCVRDVLLASINRGQLPTLGFLVIVGILILKMPPQNASELAFHIVKNLEQGQLLSYIFNVLLLIGWFFHAKSLRREHSQETQRIGREKSKLQERLAKEEFRSSDEK